MTDSIDPKDLDKRLKQLADLRDSGVLSQKDYELARRLAVAKAMSPSDEPSASDTSTETHRARPRLLWVLTGAVVVLAIALVAVLVVATQGGDEEQAAAGSGAPAPSPPQAQLLRFSASCDDEYVCPVVYSLTGQQRGSTIRVTMRYCDRTDGRVQQQTYTFRLFNSQGQPMPWSDSSSKAQTRACDTITSNLVNNYSPGTYQAHVRIFNAYTGQTGTAKSDGFRIR
jgi:hypothetical protein